jgi:hypothetical protein
MPALGQDAVEYRDMRMKLRVGRLQRQLANVRVGPTLLVPALNFDRGTRRVMLKANPTGLTGFKAPRAVLTTARKAKLGLSIGHRIGDTCRWISSNTMWRISCAIRYAANCMHAEHVGPQGVAYVSGRRRNGRPLTREMRPEGFEVVHGGQAPGFTEDLHAHDFDVRIMVLGGEITVGRRIGNLPRLRSLRDTGGLPAHHEGVAQMVGKADRRAATN